ncbi:MAG: cytochrome c [Chloroflexota bacterium]
MRTRKTTTLFVALALAALVAACGNLQEQPKLHSPYDESPLFYSAAREPLPETVPVGFLQEDEHLYTGMVDGAFAETFPYEITAEIIAEGQREFDSYCTPCHGNAGYGDGILSQEGFPPPASFHDAEIAAKPVGHYFDVITNGQNAMYSYATRVTPEERWAVIAYIRVLQESQNPGGVNTAMSDAGMDEE